MQIEHLYNLIAKKFTKEISEDEKAELELWYNENQKNIKLYNKLDSIWQKSVDTNIDYNPEIPGAIKAFKERVKLFEKQKQRRTILLRASQIAASVLIIISLTYYINLQKQASEIVEIISDNTTVKEVILPDSSIIFLNNNTSVKYKKSFKNRNIELNGEAFFEIKKLNNKPFTVESNNTYTKVLGTSFNIKSRKEINSNVQISVVTGKVKFSGNKNDKTVILTQNQQAVYNDETSEIETSELVNNNFLAWKTGTLIFKNTPLKEVLVVLKDVYNIEYSVTTNEVLDLKVTCEFDNAEIGSIIDDLELFLPIKTNFNKNHIKIEPLK